MADSLFPGDDLPDDEVVDAYVASVTDMPDDSLNWVHLHVGNLIFLDRVEEGWVVITAAIERVSDRQVLCQIGAGALEDLVVHHGADWIDRIEAQARASEKFRIALGCVWGGDPDVRSRIDLLLAQ